MFERGKTRRARRIAGLGSMENDDPTDKKGAGIGSEIAYGVPNHYLAAASV
jgi:hypothetical protein